MSKVTIQVRDDGSLFVSGGEFELIDAEGNAFETRPKVSLCRCGLTANKPFCDGSHKGKFQDRVRAPKPEASE
ncbi:CDGSH iron-sulfur domain-containing protein [Bacillus horti]|uniref:CDGSH-type Zn-finger protein n=1 Tax=Caldalkalibacillus horti TaxID=77523 RepID=A0ABT9VWD7_9BACI|nr:CDGSH iron-sulfur domain-containing protein [Bacillus horti]MDQ0165288.1 CDGSH-type Zn-finger protein [Bacillus horti]